MNRRLEAMFVVALLGVLLAVGVALSALGPAAVGVYAVLATAAVALAARRAQARRAAAAGRTCTCCTSTVHDPVEVR
jgi:hypothetical protein